MNETSMGARAVDLFQSFERTEESLFINSNLPRPGTLAHEAGRPSQLSSPTNVKTLGSRGLPP